MTATPDMHEYILETAGKLFYEHGLRAIGVDRVIAEAGIAKATLYRHFPTKERLMVTYLQRRSAAALGAIHTELEGVGEASAARIDALFGRLARVMNSGFRGCAFIRALSEHLESDAIRAEVIRHKDAVRELIGGLLAPQQAELRDTLFLLYEGALSMGLVYQDNRGALSAHKAAMALFKGG